MQELRGEAKAHQTTTGGKLGWKIRMRRKRTLPQGTYNNSLPIDISIAPAPGLVQKKKCLSVVRGSYIREGKCSVVNISGAYSPPLPSARFELPLSHRIFPGRKEAIDQPPSPAMSLGSVPFGVRELWYFVTHLIHNSPWSTRSFLRLRLAEKWENPSSDFLVSCKSLRSAILIIFFILDAIPSVPRSQILSEGPARTRPFAAFIA